MLAKQGCLITCYPLTSFHIWSHLKTPSFQKKITFINSEHDEVSKGQISARNREVPHNRGQTVNGK